MFWRFMSVIVTLHFVVLSTSVTAGVIIGGTRVIYSGNKSDATINVKNNEVAIPYLIQAWVDPFDAKAMQTPPPFTVIPPVSRLDAGQEKVLRIMKIQGSLPEDRESVFWLNIKNIPPASAKSNSLEIAIKTRIKLFWRPAKIVETPERAASKVKWHIQNHKLMVENPSPLHVNVMSVHVDGKDVPLNIIKPFETLTLTLPEGISGHSLVWRFVNDFGGISQDIRVAL
jgi:P pilus assembly chaperone PapD